jgi:2-methylcitrate dehydratase PrpD
LGGHPSAPIVPALFAIADMTNVSGRDLVTAFVAGFETSTRIGRAVNFHHYEKGWHPTVTLGVFGVAAASAHLLRLTETQTATALAIAASLASGVKANFGTMTKPLHVGHCARSGLFAALLAREGYTANPGTFEHKQGFFEVFNGAGTYDPARLFEGWAKPFDIERPGLGIKLYPCCGSTHGPIDGMLTLTAKHAIRADDVERIEARIHRRRLAHTDRPDPQTGLEGKFSVQYCLARAIIDRKVVLEHFEDEAVREPAVRALTHKVRTEAYSSPLGDNGDHYGVDLAVTLRSGERLTLRQERPTGRSPEDPTPPERLEAKFLSCASRAVNAAAATRLLEALKALDDAANARDVIAHAAG